MTKLMWGLLGPEKLASERRTRTLGVGASVRSFNDLAVPGLGGVWFGKQLFLPTLGVAVAERARAGGKGVQNIETANAIEALACWLGLNGNGWQSDARLQGRSKMEGKNDLSFAVVRKREFYVTQPMRMATVQPLPALGLVDANGSRFNAFACSQHGHDFIEALCTDHRHSKSIFEILVNWAKGESAKVTSNGQLRGVLSPLEPMPPSACEILRDRLIQGNNQESLADKERRRAALRWVDSLRSPPNQKLAWDNKPQHIEDAHWHDMHAGALFLSARNAAICVLDRLEAHIGNQAEQRYFLADPIPDSVKPDIQSLQVHAQAFLNQQHTDELANAFCKECIGDGHDTLLANLVGRDEHVLRLRDRIVLPGPAFLGKSIRESDAEQSSTEGATPTSTSDAIVWPEGLSNRVRNLFLLNVDLHGELFKWLSQVVDTGDEQ